MNSTFSTDYIKQLVEHTNISDQVIANNEEEIKTKVNDVLAVANSCLNKGGKISKKIISLILKEKGYNFI